MALTKTTEIDKIEIVGPFKMVQLREATIIKEDDVEISRSFNRRVIAPTDSKTGEATDIKAVCTAVQTTAVKSAYTAHLASLEE
jgi:hypothetical protein